MSNKISKPKIRKQQRTATKKGKNIPSDLSEESDPETESDEDRTKKKAIDLKGPSVANNSSRTEIAWEDSEDDPDGHSVYNESPFKRKRAMSMSEFFDIPDDSDTAESPQSLDDLDFGDLGDSEDDQDIEKFEGDALIQEEEDKGFLHKKYRQVDDDQPFAYAPDDDTDHQSNTEEFWIEDFDAMVGGATNFDTTQVPRFDADLDESPDALLEDDFFLDVDVCNSDAQSDSESVGGADESTFTFGAEDDDDRVGWECFFSDGESHSEEDKESETDGATTDDELPAVVLARQQIASSNPTTPVTKIPAKSNLTSLIKQTSMVNDETPSKVVVSTPVKLNTSHQPPVLGTWARDSRRLTGIIDGMTTHSPSGMPPPSSVKKSLKDKRTPYERSEAMNAAMTSLDDIMYTNDFLVGSQYESYNKFDKPIHVGAFRKGQQRSSMIREDSLKDEWYTMTSRNKEKPGRSRSTPILGVASESLSRKEKRRRKKLKMAAGMSINGSMFGGSLEDTSDVDDDGIERAGLGLGPPVESLFLFHQV